MTKNILILGATGSIGRQTLDVCRLLEKTKSQHSHEINIVGISGYSNKKLLYNQAEEFNLAENQLATNIEGIGLLIKNAPENTLVLNALVGNIGIDPTIKALERGFDVALANKETLVAAGGIINSVARKHKAKIIPVDSEHSAIFQCLQGNENNKIEKIILTCSGGAFFGYSPLELRCVEKSQIVNPNWDMGAKVTLDSATLMNKGLEFIEAMHLFNVSPEQIEVVIHRQSILHSAVEFEDRAIIAQMGSPDMRLPIQYALLYPDRIPSPAKKISLFDLVGQNSLTFEKPDLNTFTCLKTMINAAKYGNLAPCFINAVNELADSAFFAGKIKFYDIFEIISDSFDFYIEYSHKSGNTFNNPLLSYSSLENIKLIEELAVEFFTKRVKF